MSSITFEDYKLAIKANYVEKREEEPSGILLNPTPAQLRNLCLLLLENGLSPSDINAFKMFFNSKEQERIRTSIEHFDIGKFKPIISFLKGEKDSDHVARIELAAVLVNYKPRPYVKYLQNGKKSLGDSTFLIQTTNKPVNNKQLVEKADENQVMVNSGFNLKKQVVIGIALILSLFFVRYTVKDFFFAKKHCMQWKENQFEEVDCSTNHLGIGQLNTIVPFDENLIHLKKIEVNKKSVFFKYGKAVVWYSKNEGKVEIFNGPGFHPESGKPLKPITKYMIKKYKLEAK
ncbi:hypothetical protein RCH18_001994 [Flavobacterium sp. PL11]|uniref:hypothetical protein n=1 Tax=Flavobacterium sp. PL11 TaxID=3071717 RepID=UPI002DFBE816|nr:hypothetical protein [Flavobacterium sp. PL11]